MADRHPAQRVYSSSLRHQQQELTRNRIMEAACSLVAEGRIHSFTMHEVAARAGVSYASVYRHFPTREALLEEVYEWGQHAVFQAAPAPPRTADEIPAWAEKLVGLFEANAHLVHAGTMALTALGLVPKTQGERDEEIRGLIQEAAPGLNARELRLKAAVIRFLASSLAWATLRQRFGLSSREIAAALAWALQALVGEVERDGARTDDDGPEKGEEV